MRIQDRHQGYVLYQLWGEAIAKRIGNEYAKNNDFPRLFRNSPAWYCETPSVFAGDGCGTGTVLVDGVCQLAPQESNDGCGTGTVMVNGVCQLDKSSGGSIPPLYIAGGAAVIGAAIIGIVFAVRRGSGGTSTPKPARQNLDDYEDQYLRRQGQRPSPKPAEARQTSSSCNSCGKPLKPTAKFCGKCGTPRS